MADTAQAIYEYTAGNSISFFVDGLEIECLRPGLSIDITVDGTKIVTDTGASQLIFSGTAILTGSNLNTLLTVQRGAITYSGAYPRLTTINLATGVTLTNIEVAMTRFGKAADMGGGKWAVPFEFMEKDQ